MLAGKTELSSGVGSCVLGTVGALMESPMTDKRKKAARELAAKTGMTYQGALNALTAKRPGSPAPTIVDNEARPSGRAAFYAEASEAWRALVGDLLGDHAKVAWRSPDAVAEVLSMVARRAPNNHCYFPAGGGQDLEAAAVSAGEPGCIELAFAFGKDTVLRPALLELVRPANDTLDNLTYFWLECAPLEPCGLYRETSKYGDEVVTEVAPGRYVSSDEDAGDARCLRRQLRGTFVIWAKTSAYNMLPTYDTYLGHHSKLSAEEFRALVEMLVAKLREQGLYGVDLHAARGEASRGDDR
jgi:serine/threonine-protein kinase